MFPALFAIAYNEISLELNIFMLSQKQGAALVKEARKSIEYYFAEQTLLEEPAAEKAFKEKLGVFVTLHTFPKNELRGCIGFPLPVASLWEGVIEAAVAAAFSDNRFNPLERSELEEIILEVSVLTRPEKIEWKSEKELLKQIRIGKDGLIVKQGFRSGLLLPQVGTQYQMSSKQLLEATCEKAFLGKGAWKENGTIIEKFQAQIFKETKPKGRIVEEK